jgi:hypothetical protein
LHFAQERCCFYTKIFTSNSNNGYVIKPRTGIGAFCLPGQYLYAILPLYGQLALDHVSRLGKQLAGRLLAHHEFLAIGGCELVRRVGLSKAKLSRKTVSIKKRSTRNHAGLSNLLHVQRRFDYWQVLLKVPLERGNVDWLSQWARHLHSQTGWK